MAGPDVVPAALQAYGADCPIPAPVWAAFADARRQATSDRDAVVLDVLVEAVDDSAGAPSLGRLLRGTIHGTDGRSDVFVVGPLVAVGVRVDDLLLLLHATSWRPMVEKAASLSARELASELAAAGGEIRPRKGWSAREIARLRWILVQNAIALDLSGQSLGRRVAATLDRLVPNSEAKNALIRSVGLNRPVQPAVFQSRTTVKADAAERLFDVDACDVTWAVIDTGIDETNPAFANHRAGAGEPRTRIEARYDVARAVNKLRREDATFNGIVSDTGWAEFFRLANLKDDRVDPPVDERIRHHGTHVAGILAGDEGNPVVPPRDRPLLRGVCPTVRLVDLRVFDADGGCNELAVIVAMQVVRRINDQRLLGGLRLIDGVNLSLSTRYHVGTQACGWTPVCAEAERLVASGVVVVAAAGNEAYDEAASTQSVGTGFRFQSITDPGNAESVITVGATDKEAPYRFGPLASSGRGPTADGRHKPDLLAPGFEVLGPTYGEEPLEMTGTSQAAPHVSAVAAMLLGRYPELRGHPARVKKILVETASDLGRLQDYQGAGLVDALRALQRV